MKAFVTGSTGLVGSNLIPMLVEQGYEVKALVRSIEKARRFLGDVNVEFVEGDMLDIPAFADEMAGCDVLFHGAAYFREYFSTGDHWKMLETINVKGTLDIIEAAEQRGVGKVIYISSGGVIGRKPDGSAGDETTPPDKIVNQNLYFRSKVIAEEKLAEFLKTHHIPVVLILPAAIFGPSDNGPTGAGQMILDFIHGKLPAIPSGGFTTVDARDVAQAMINAVEKGKSGERYIIHDRYHSVEDILKIISEITGIPMLKMHLPYPMGLAFAHVSELIARITGNEPIATVSAIKTLNARQDTKTDKAVRELGISIRPLKDSLRDEVIWYQQHGYIKKDLPALKTIKIGSI